jgi:type II protein arginine methyltransferase
MLNTSTFLTNKKGYPTLSRRHQEAAAALMRFRVQFVVKGRPRHARGYLPYLQYLEHLRNKRWVVL